MGREIFRGYLATPELFKDGVQLPTTPINLANGDWLGLNRLLEEIRQAVIHPSGTITGRTFRTAVAPDQRVEIDTANGIRLYDSNGILTAQFDGDSLTIINGTITGGTIVGSTFKTATSGERVEIDSANGIRTFDSGGILISQLKGTITFAAGVVSGTALTNNTVASSKVNLAARGWTQTSVFSVTDSDTIAWGAGTFTASDGTAYSIGTGNTGNMAAKTYVYLDIAASTTAYQITTTAGSAVGDGKVLVAVCQNNTAEAVFQVFGGVGGLNIDASNIVTGSLTANEIAASTITAAKIAASTITANEIAASTITAAKIAAATITTTEIAASTILAGNMNVSTLSAITADLGTITAGSVDSATITGGTITGTTFMTAGSGNNRVTIDSTNGLQLIDSGNTTRVQLSAAVYAGMVLNGIRSIDTNDLFLESQNQTVQLFVSQSSDRVSFVTGSATRGYFDSNDGNGAGNQPTSLVVKVNGSLQRVNRASAGGFLYI